MAKSPTVKQILVGWLNTIVDTNPEFKSHHIETDVVAYGKSLGVLHSPGTYSRAFRDMKSPDRGRSFGFEIDRAGVTSGGEQIWKVKRFA